jgi:hypothetical protein
MDVDFPRHCLSDVFLRFAPDPGIAGGVEFDLAALPDGGDLVGADNLFEFDDWITLGRWHRPCLAVVCVCSGSLIDSAIVGSHSGISVETESSAK